MTGQEIPYEVAAAALGLPTESRRMNLLLIDNYDSFTFNLVQAVRTLNVGVTVVRNDAGDVGGLAEGDYCGAILSPGPGEPQEAGICVDFVRRLPAFPILGVCLGHQVLAYADGAKIVRAEPRHGKTSRIRHDGTDLFASIPSPCDVMRYHSLGGRTAEFAWRLAVDSLVRRWNFDGHVPQTAPTLGDPVSSRVDSDRARS